MKLIAQVIDLKFSMLTFIFPFNYLRTNCSIRVKKDRNVISFVYINYYYTTLPHKYLLGVYLLNRS